ncbi:unnamed protein product [Meloidogyne enterolobii]|uniref:Uncharacterized protein n=1 Tax=Meloidogyne enterolobii TaxID=390850 RepID=A0ACB1ANL8_MELEN
MRLPVTPRERKNSLFCDVDCGFTVMLLGDSCTGKTCILIRFKDNTFMNNNFISTVGIDYRVWDTAGQERFRSLTASYYRDADALLLIYDVTNRASFEHIRDWLAQVKEYAKDEVALTLVGNKVDLGHQRKVRADEGRQLAKVIGRFFGDGEGNFLGGTWKSWGGFLGDRGRGFLEETCKGY